MNTTKSVTVMTVNRVLNYALSVAESHRDDTGEIILTWLDEDVQDHFNLSDEQYEDADYSFLIFKALEHHNLL